MLGVWYRKKQRMHKYHTEVKLTIETPTRFERGVLFRDTEQKTAVKMQIDVGYNQLDKIIRIV